MSLQKQVIDLKKKRTVNADVDVFFTEKHGFPEISCLTLIMIDKHIFIRPTVQTNLS